MMLLIVKQFFNFYKKHEIDIKTSFLYSEYILRQEKYRSHWSPSPECTYLLISTVKSTFER